MADDHELLAVIQREGSASPPHHELQERNLPMLRWTIIFIVIAVIAELFGLSGVAGEAAWIAHVLFVIFLVLFILSFIFRGRPPAV
jgi:uncharacterized membrane protein YtjA (UPF0391 family)